MHSVVSFGKCRKLMYFFSPSLINFFSASRSRDDTRRERKSRCCFEREGKENTQCFGINIYSKRACIRANDENKEIQSKCKLEEKERTS